MFKKVFLDHWIDWTVAIIIMVFIVVWGAVQQYSIEVESENLAIPTQSLTTKPDSYSFNIEYGTTTITHNEDGPGFESRIGVALNIFKNGNLEKTLTPDEFPRTSLPRGWLDGIGHEYIGDTKFQHTFVSFGDPSVIFDVKRLRVYFLADDLPYYYGGNAESGVAMYAYDITTGTVQEIIEKNYISRDKLKISPDFSHVVYTNYEYTSEDDVDSSCYGLSSAGFELINLLNGKTENEFHWPEAFSELKDSEGYYIKNKGWNGNNEYDYDSYLAKPVGWGRYPKALTPESKCTFIDIESRPIKI